MTTEQQEPEKRYDPADGTLRFVTRPDDITLDDDPDSLKVEMSCGHVVTRQSLIEWCRSLLDQGQYVFRCPALKDDTEQKCGVQWTYPEVRKLAVLTTTEQEHFEVTLRALATAEYKTREQQELEKRYGPADGTLRYVIRPDDITLDDDPDSLRAVMSCGHAVTPQTLTAWCRSLLDQGQYVFRCPALKDGTLQKCGVQWTYPEVRKLAVLTATEQHHFEVTLAALATVEYCECKTCPGCQTSVERKNLSNLCVQCTVCTAETGRLFQFCWQCLQSWKGPGPRSDRCDNQGCTNKELELLTHCPTTSLPQVPGVADCPSLQACPTCGLLLEHDRSGCKGRRKSLEHHESLCSIPAVTKRTNDTLDSAESD